jgi:hypothetical protein
MPSSFHITNQVVRQHARTAAASGFIACLLLASSGCSLGMLFPTSIGAELREETPLRVPAPQVRTIAIALPSMLEQILLLPDPSRGKLDKVALDIAERLEDSERFKIVSTDQFQTALAAQRPEPDSLRVSLTEPDSRTAILKAAQQVGADAVLLFEGRWESPLSLGNIQFGRPEFKRQVTMTLVATASSAPIWHQQATAIVNEGIATPQEPAIRRAVASSLAKNFLQTIK